MIYYGLEDRKAKIQKQIDQFDVPQKSSSNNPDFYIQKALLIIDLEKEQDRKIDLSDQILQLFDQAIEIDPYNPKFYEQKSSYLLQKLMEKEMILEEPQRTLERILQIYQCAHDVDPYNPELYEKKAQFIVKIGENLKQQKKKCSAYQQAIENYDLAIELDPTNSNVLEQKANTHVRLGSIGNQEQKIENYKKAIICLDSIIGQGCANFKIYERKANILVYLGDQFTQVEMQSYYYNLAIECYENLTNNKFFPVDINEKKAYFLYNIASKFKEELQLSYYQRALEQFEISTNKNMEQRAIFLLNIGDKVQEQDKFKMYKLAISYFNQMISVDSLNLNVYFKIAYLLLNMSEKLEANKQYMQNLSLEYIENCIPEQKNISIYYEKKAHFLVSFANQAQKDLKSFYLDEAAKSFDQATLNDCDNPKIYSKKGQFFKCLGEQNELQLKEQYYRKALACYDQGIQKFKGTTSDLTKKINILIDLNESEKVISSYQYLFHIQQKEVDQNKTFETVSKLAEMYNTLNLKKQLIVLFRMNGIIDYEYQDICFYEFNQL